MPVYFNGRIVNVGKNQFKGEKGEDVSYNIYTIAHEQGVITLNSKRDFSQYLNVPATITLTLRPESKLFKATLTEIKPLAADGEAEIT